MLELRTHSTYQKKKLRTHSNCVVIVVGDVIQFGPCGKVFPLFREPPTTLFDLLHCP